MDAPLTELGLAPDGSLEVPPPARRDLAGWYRDGTTPGATGTAVIAGHVDHATGPAVFYNLGALRRGAAIEVPRADGRTAVFTVHAIEVYDADAFPDSRVYGPSPRAELRVITCGGGFSHRTGYRGTWSSSPTSRRRTEPQPHCSKPSLITSADTTVSSTPRTNPLPFLSAIRAPTMLPARLNTAISAASCHSTMPW